MRLPGYGMNPPQARRMPREPSPPSRPLRAPRVR
jgi:hypothetical protein